MNVPSRSAGPRRRAAPSRSSPRARELAQLGAPRLGRDERHVAVAGQQALDLLEADLAAADDQAAAPAQLQAGDVEGRLEHVAHAGLVADPAAELADALLAGVGVLAGMRPRSRVDAPPTPRVTVVQGMPRQPLHDDSMLRRVIGEYVVGALRPARAAACRPPTRSPSRASSRTPARSTTPTRGCSARRGCSTSSRSARGRGASARRAACARMHRACAASCARRPGASRRARRTRPTTRQLLLWILASLADSALARLRALRARRCRARRARGAVAGLPRRRAPVRPARSRHAGRLGGLRGLHARHARAATTCT